MSARKICVAMCMVLFRICGVTEESLNYSDRMNPGSIFHSSKDVLSTGVRCFPFARIWYFHENRKEFKGVLILQGSYSASAWKILGTEVVIFD